MGQEGFSPEHANLINDVIPSAGSLELLCEQPVELFPHLDDTTGHRLDIYFPLLEQLGGVQDQRDQSRAMSWGVTDFAAREDGELTAGPVRDLGRGGNYVQGADAFTVQTSVLGETLTDQQRDAPIDEFPDCPSIVVQIAAGETLIGAVKEGVVALL